MVAGIGAIVTVVICFILFKPFKFDDDKYQNWSGWQRTTSYVSPKPIPQPESREKSSSEMPDFFGNSALSSFPAAQTPYWLVDGFSDYTDGQILWSPFEYKACYKARKDYLINKMFRYGFYSLIIIFVLLLVIRYFTKGQQWVLKNAK